MDSGSSISLIKSVYVPGNMRFDIESSSCEFFVINGSKLIVQGVFVKEIRVESIPVTVSFLIVSDATMDHAALLGRDFISCPSLTITLGEK